MSVGSPALAAYSLVITARNVRMVKQRASSSKHKERKEVARALIALQQQSYKLTEDEKLLYSIPNDDRWRKQILERLDKKNAWSLATASIVTWVIIAFFFTLVSSFVFLGDPNGVVSEGLAVGAFWLWLLCLVVCWLRVPVYSSSEIGFSIRRLNEKTTKFVNKTLIRPAREVIRLMKKLQKMDSQEELEKSNTLPAAGEGQEPKSNPSSSATPLHVPADNQQEHSPYGDRKSVV